MAVRFRKCSSTSTFIQAGYDWNDGPSQSSSFLAIALQTGNKSTTAALLDGMASLHSDDLVLVSRLGIVTAADIHTMKRLLQRIIPAEYKEDHGLFQNAKIFYSFCQYPLEHWARTLPDVGYAVLRYGYGSFTHPPYSRRLFWARSCFSAFSVSTLAAIGPGAPESCVVWFSWEPASITKGPLVCHVPAPLLSGPLGWASVDCFLFCLREGTTPKTWRICYQKRWLRRSSIWIKTTHDTLIKPGIWLRPQNCYQTTVGYVPLNGFCEPV